MDVGDSSVVVVSSDRSFGEALAAGLARRGHAARFLYPGETKGTVNGILVLDVAANGHSGDLDVATLVGPRTERTVVLGSDVHGALGGVAVHATVPPTVTLDVLAAAVDGSDAKARPRSTTTPGRPGRVALSVKEREVLRELLAGNSTARIADRWSVSEQAVRDHVQAACAKLGVRTRAEATAWALKAGLTPAGARQQASA